VKNKLVVVTIVLMVLSMSFLASAQQINILMEAVPDTNYVLELIPQFEDLTGVTVNVEVINYSEMHEKLIPQMLARQASYDVIVVDNYWVGEFSTAGWLSDLTPFLEASDVIDVADYLESMFDMVGQVDGIPYMLPFYNYTMALVYRTDIIEDTKFLSEYEEHFGKSYVFPDNLPDYIELAKFLTKDGFYGASMQGLRPDPIAMEWLNYLYALGGDIYDADGKTIINNEIGQQALSLYVDAMNNAAPPGAPGFGFDEAYTVIAQGNTFSYITYNWMLPLLDDPSDSAIAGHVSIAPVPGGSSLNGGWGWAIPHNSPNPDLAWQFLEWVESFEIAKERALMGGSPTRYDVFSDSDVLSVYPHYTLVKEVIANATMIPIIEQATQLVEIIGREISLAVTGKDAVQALNDAAREIDRLRR